MRSYGANWRVRAATDGADMDDTTCQGECGAGMGMAAAPVGDNFTFLPIFLGFKGDGRRGGFSSLS